MKLPKRDRDVRVEITHRVFGEYSSLYWINKGTIFDGYLDKAGNFIVVSPSKHQYTVVYPTHFKVIGKFYFRKSK